MDSLDHWAEFFHVGLHLLQPSSSEVVRRIHRNGEPGWYWQDRAGAAPAEYYGPFPNEDAARAHALDTYVPRADLESTSEI